MVDAKYCFVLYRLLALQYIGACEVRSSMSDVAGGRLGCGLSFLMTAASDAGAKRDVHETSPDLHYWHCASFVRITNVLLRNLQLCNAPALISRDDA